MAWFHSPASRLPLTKISAINPLSIELSIGSMNVPKMRGDTVPRLLAGSTRTVTIGGIGLTANTCAPADEARAANRSKVTERRNIQKASNEVDCVRTNTIGGSEPCQGKYVNLYMLG